MPLFQFTVLSESGALSQGERVAADARALVAELSQQGLRVQSFRVRRQWWPFARGAVKAEALYLFTQEFSALLRAGLPIPEALQIAGTGREEHRLTRAVQDILEAIRGGAALSDACARHPQIFDPVYVAAIKTGEKAGDLVGALRQYQGSLRTRIAFEKRVRQALAYPVFLLITLGVIMALLFAFVMPRFVAMYADFGTELPLPTRLLIAFSERLYLYIPLLFVGLIAAVYAFRRFRAVPANALALDRLKERLPRVGQLYRELAAARLARVLATLVATGTPLLDAMRSAGHALHNVSQRARLQEAAILVSEGESLAQAFKRVQLLPLPALKMIEVGEASGHLGSMLDEVAAYYEEKLEAKWARMSALIEPMIMLLIGILIGGVIVVMYLPIFNMADMVR